jgi:hypothetical protein
VQVGSFVRAKKNTPIEAVAALYIRNLDEPAEYFLEHPLSLRDVASIQLH